MFSKVHRIIWISLIAFTLGATAGMAETPIWESGNSYPRSFGFDILETNTSGQDMVLVTVDPSSSDNRVDVYQVGPGQGTSSIMSIYEPVSIAHKRAFGHDVGSVGDVNGDGYDDFVVCAALTCSCYEPDESAGFYLYHGGPGMDTIPEVTALLYAGGGLRLIGRGVVGGGDWNADGYDDFAISAYIDQTPVALIYFGGPNLDHIQDMVIEGPNFKAGYEHTLLFADVNGDGADDLISSAEGDWGDTVEIYLGGPSPDAIADIHIPRVGPYASLGVGDINGDMYDDLVVGEIGRALIYYGSSSFDTDPDAIFNEDPERFFFNLQSRIEVIHTDPTDPGGDVWISTRFFGSIVVFDSDSGTTITPEYAFPSNSAAGSARYGELFLGMNDLNGDGAEELLIFDESFSFNVYEDLFFDCDSDGVPDNQEVIDGTLGDCDGNGLHDLCETTIWTTLDCNADLAIDSCQMDELDCDLNGEIDSCEIAIWSILDCNGNGVLDVCEVLPAGYDCDQNGIADCWEIDQDWTKDCDHSGRLDVCEYDDLTVDCDNNGNFDHCQLATAPWQDCNDDNIVDSCQISLPGYDCDLSGVLDVCEGSGEAVIDCNANDKMDLCEMEQIVGSDCNGNGFPDDCDPNPWVGPCRTQPYIQTYFDEALTITEINAAAMPTNGFIWIAVRGLHADLAGAIDRFEFTVEQPDGILFYGGTLPEEDIDHGPGPLDWLVSLDAPWSVDANGDLILIKMSYLITGTLLPNSRIGLVGSSFSETWMSHPILHDITAGDTRLLDARSAWINLMFMDCNHNDLDDAIDIANGTSADLDLNGIPDECQTSSLGPLPAALSLSPVAPNPFNPSTEIRFEMPEAGRVLIEIYDFAGRRVRTLLNAEQAGGVHTLDWNGRDNAGNGVSSGVYLLRLVAHGQTHTRKMALLR